MSLTMVRDGSEPGYYHAISGATSGCMTRFLCQPLDVIKIRFQLQVEPIKEHSMSKYHSMKQTFLLIAKEEGLPALWKGHVPAQVLSVIYGTCQFYMFSIINQQFVKFGLLNDTTKSMHLLSGALAGSIATFAAFPLDIIRTRLIAQSTKHRSYKGMLHSCKTIYKSESIRGFYRGIIPAIIQIAPHTGLQFWSYELIKQINFFPTRQVIDDDHHRKVSIVNSLVAGCLAGIVAKTILYPLDLAKKRLQIQGFEKGRIGFGGFFHCNGLVNCLDLTIKKEGMPGLFKGLGPSVIKAALTTGLQFTFYEQILDFLRNTSPKY